MVEIKNLTKRYDKSAKPAIDNISCKIRNSKVYGLVGPRGAGKTTLIDMMAGVVCPTDGTIVVNGYDIRKQPLAAKKQMGYLPQDLPVFPNMTVYECMAFIASAKGVKGELLQAQIKEALSLTELSSVQDRLVQNLSAAQHQSLGIAQTLLGTPDVILMDEPFQGLEPHRITLFKELIRKLGQTRTILVAAEHISEIRDLCDRVILLSEGRIVAEDVPDVFDTPSDAVTQAEDEQTEEILTADYEEQEEI